MPMIQRLRDHDQAALADHVAAAGDDVKRALTKQLEPLDLAEVEKLVGEYVTGKPEVAIPDDLSPPTVYPRVPPADRAAEYQAAEREGLQLLKDGKVAAFLVAGGQGSRLGYDGPKGEYPVTPVKNKPLFQTFAEQLLAWGKVAGKTIPWYVMTSEVNDAATRKFFEQNKYFGYAPDDVMFFAQGMLPAFDMKTGQMLLADEQTLALSPDGHGGSLRALDKSGALADMRGRGVEHLSYFQVDNPLVHVIDPLFLGLHATTGSEMSSKGLPKAEAKEKVGNFAMSGGAGGDLMVIEYSDLPDELAEATDEDGKLKFNMGSIAIHALRVSFVERLNEGGRLNLPYHRAEKKVAHVGDPEPEGPNAVKLEQFVFDAIPMAENPLLLETDRAEEFSPVKNAEGNDSPATSRRDQIRRAARWLEAAGVDVPRNPQTNEPDATIEIAPTFAATESQLREKNIPPTPIQPGAVLYLGE